MSVEFPQDEMEFYIFCQQIANITNKTSIYLEIGSRQGGSLYVASGFLPKGSTIISIDLPNARWGMQNSEIRLNTVCNELDNEGYNVHKILADSTSAKAKQRLATLLKNDYIDVLFIDGDHTIDVVTSDWNTYSPMVRNGIIAFHDIVHSNDETGVEVGQLWSSLRTKYKYLEIVFVHGIGVIWKPY